MSVKGISKKKLMTSILMGIFVIALLNNSLNRHNHIVSGFLYSHAHPFSKTAKDNPAKGAAHKHTQIELFFLNLLTDQDFLEIVFLGLAAAYGTVLLTRNILSPIHIPGRINNRLTPRAPPF